MGDRLSSDLVNSSAKNIYTFIRVSPPGWCHPGRSAPSPSDATDCCRQLTYATSADARLFHTGTMQLILLSDR